MNSLRDVLSILISGICVWWFLSLVAAGDPLEGGLVRRRAVVAQSLELTRAPVDTADAMLATSTVDHALWFHKVGTSLGLRFGFLLSGTAAVTVKGDGESYATIASSTGRSSINLRGHRSDDSVSLHLSGSETLFRMVGIGGVTSPSGLMIGTLVDDQVGIELVDQNGKARIGLSQSPRASGILLADREQRIRSLLAVSTRDGLDLMFHDRSMRVTLDVSLNRDGTPFFQINDPVKKESRIIAW